MNVSLCHTIPVEAKDVKTKKTNVLVSGKEQIV
jgi:hypothetical protein